MEVYSFPTAQVLLFVQAATFSARLLKIWVMEEMSQSQEQRCTVQAPLVLVFVCQLHCLLAGVSVQACLRAVQQT